MPTLLERLGGSEAVKAVVNSFYDRVFADPLLTPFFRNSDQVAQRRRQTTFLISFLNGTAQDAVGYMRRAHRDAVEKQNLNTTHFDAVAIHLVGTLQEFGVSPELIAEVAEGLELLRPAVLNQPADAITSTAASAA